jgi:hypothetical protein
MLGGTTCRIAQLDERGGVFLALQEITPRRQVVGIRLAAAAGGEQQPEACHDGTMARGAVVEHL